MSRTSGLVVAVVGSLLLLVPACGSDAPAAYRVADLATGEEVSLDDLQGEPALLISWATWCRECDEELAGLQEFASSSDAEGVRIVAVNLDAADNDEIQSKIDRHGLTVELWRDRRNEFRQAFGALGVPTTVVIAADGEVVGTFPGAVDFGEQGVLDALDRARGQQ